MAQARKFSKILRKQLIMRRVILALVPCVVGSVYFFGWRCLFLVLWAAVVGFLVEFIFTRQRNEPVSEAVFVTTTLFALIMPPTVPIHVLTIGVAFAVMFAKEVFGGFGRNFFNPAMAGRCFVYICFPVALTSTWAPAATGIWGALDRWATVASADAVTAATPMADLKSGKLILTKETAADVTQAEVDEFTVMSPRVMVSRLFLGRISGTMGVTSALLIVIGGVYLFYKKIASRSIIVTLIITYVVCNQILTWAGVPRFYGSLVPLLGGGFLFGAFYMATDPVTAPKTGPARIIYAVLIGVFATIIRNFSLFNGGLMFSILMGNMFSPILDYWVGAYRSGKAARGEGK